MAPKRVLVVGAGASGMAAADTLSNHPDRFQVTLVDAVDYCGGQAFSISIDKERHGAEWLNQGVQGGSNIFHHTFRMFRKQGFHADPVELQVSFGKGDIFWSNLFPTKIIERHQKEIKKFMKVLKFIHYTEVLFLYVPIRRALKMFFFSEEFINHLILPMIALFLGTGNATPQVSAVIMERLFTSPTFGMWYPGDSKALASNLPPMVVFPEFSKFYETWRQDLVKRGVTVRLSTEVTQVLSRSGKGVKVAIKARRPVEDGMNPNDADKDIPSHVEEYDEIIFAVLADTAKRLLGKDARWIEKQVLGSAKFSDDITVTHWDSAYMEKHYTNRFDPDQAVHALGDRDETGRIERGKTEFKPMYYIIPQHEESDPTKLDMCFDCSNYQSQFPRDIPFDKHIFQTIFLNKKDEKYWTIDEIDKSKVIKSSWWHQLEHGWTHYLKVVPMMMWLQGRKHTRFAGSWTLVNAHEMAIVSGVSAAVSLGAAYPKDLEEDSFALLCFRLYHMLAHLSWYKKGKNA